MEIANINRLKRTKRLDLFLARYEEVEKLPEILLTIKRCLEACPVVGGTELEDVKGLADAKGSGDAKGSADAKSSVNMKGSADSKGSAVSKNSNNLTPLYSPGQELVLCLPGAGVPYSGLAWTGMTGIGMAGTALLAGVRREALHECGIPYHALGQAKGLLEACITYPDLSGLDERDYSGVFPVTEGGMLRTLYELCGETGLGLRVLYEAVPIKQITVEICECFDMNPWQLLSGGCLIFITSKGAALKRKLEGMGFSASRIGYLTEDKKKLICHTYDVTEEEGSCLNRPKPDEILKMLMEDIL